jgi:hypothetical protein
MKKSLLYLLLYLMALQAQSQVVPILSNGKYSFSFNNVYFEVNPTVGGRVSSVQVGGNEMLYLNQASGNDNWGATFWPAPQAIWNWPPPDTLNNKPYSTSVNGNSLVLKSGPKKKLVACSFVKTFSANVLDTSINVKYTIKNIKSTANSLSPWQIARVPSGGIAFFPTGQDAATGDLSSLATYKDGITWFDYDSTKIPTGVPKLNSDGSEGWFAFLNNQHKILIFKFADTPLSQKAPDPEDEIEIYTDPKPSQAYTELEVLGPYTPIPVADSLVWEVKWYVRDLPAYVEAKAGSASLVAYVRGIVKGGGTVLDIENENMVGQLQWIQNEEDITLVNPSSVGLQGVKVFDIMGRLVYQSQLSTSQGSYQLHKSVTGRGLINIVVETSQGVVRKKMYAY